MALKKTFRQMMNLPDENDTEILYYKDTLTFVANSVILRRAVNELNT
jgi:hypothetical protein